MPRDAMLYSATHRDASKFLRLWRKKKGYRMGRAKKSVTERKQLTVSTKIDTALYKRLEEVTRHKDLTISQVARAALREYIERFERLRKVAA